MSSKISKKWNSIVNQKPVPPRPAPRGGVARVCHVVINKISKKKFTLKFVGASHHCLLVEGSAFCIKVIKSTWCSIDSANIDAWSRSLPESRLRRLWLLQTTITQTEGSLLIFLLSGIEKLLAWQGVWTLKPISVVNIGINEISEEPYWTKKYSGLRQREHALPSRQDFGIRD